MPDAYAGTYVGIYKDYVTGAPSQYSGGTQYTVLPSPYPGQIQYGTLPDFLTGTSYRGESSGPHTSAGYSDCSGAISTSWKWVPATGYTMTTDPPPAQVIIMQTCSVSVNLGQGQGEASGLGTYDTGLDQYLSGQSGSVTFNPPASTTGGATGTYYFVMAGGAAVTLPPLNAFAHITYAPSDATLSYTATVYPVLISLSGTTKDPNAGNALKVLTGQQVTATLSVPFPVVPTSYVWSTAGATGYNPFWTWDPTWPNSNYPTQFVALTTAEMTASSFSFYDEYGGDKVTVLCNAMIQPPSGPPLAVTAKSAVITYVKPTTSWAVNQPFDGYYPGFVNQPATNDFSAVELWGPIQITEPSPFGTSGPNSVGTGVLVQIIQANRSNTRTPNNGQPATFNKLSVLNSDGTASRVASPTGLDTAFPYPIGLYKNPNGSYLPTSPDGDGYAWIVSNVGYSLDVPFQPYFLNVNDGGGNLWTTATASDSFQTWVMYRPASVGAEGTIYVPMQMLTWSWGGNAALVGLNTWAVNQTPTFTPGSPSNTDAYPSWNLSVIASNPPETP